MSGNMHIQGRIGLLAIIFILCRPVYAQTEAVPNFSPEDLASIVSSSPDQVHAFSFWASWCAPCIKEMNLLKAVQADCNCQLTLHFINVDEEQRKAKALKLARRKDIIPQMYFASTTDDSFYSQIETGWNGELPALLLVHKDQQQFFNSLMTRKKLMRFIDNAGR